MAKQNGKSMMWAYLIHLADNMWADEGCPVNYIGQYFPELSRRKSMETGN